MKKIVAIFFIVGFLVYFQSLFNGFVWDDIGQVLGNDNLYGFDKFIKVFFYNWSIYYKPLFNLVLSIALTIFGNNPFPFHLFQLVLHILNSIFVFILFSKFLKKNISFILSIIFLIHPAISEAVLYISGLQDVLYPFFGLIALNILVWWKGSKQAFLVFLFLTLSIFSKETGIVFFALVVIYKFLFAKVEFKKYLFISSIIVVIYFILRIGILGFNHPGDPDYISQWTYDADFLTRLLTIPKILLKYLTIILWPDKLQIFQIWWVRSINFSDFYIPLISVLGVFGVIFTFGIRSYLKAKEKSFPYFFFILWMILGFLPHLQFFPLDMTFSERWLYLPLIGLLGILGYIFNKIEFSKNNLKIFYLVCATIILLFSFRSFIRSFDWFNDKTISTHDFYVDQSNIGSYFVLAGYYANQFDYSKTLEIYSRLKKIAPNNENIDNNLSLIAFSQKNYKKAEEILKNSPKVLIKSKVNYTYSLLRRDPKEAELYLKKIIKETPNNSGLIALLALSQYAQGNRSEAIKNMSKAAALGWRFGQLSKLLETMKTGGKVTIDNTNVILK